MIPKKDNLRITNVVVTGKIPLKKRLDYNYIISNSKFMWFVVNEDMSPILSTRFPKEYKNLNVHKKVKSAYVSVWHSGAINIVGVQSLKEARDIYNKIVKELLRIKAIKIK